MSVKTLLAAIVLTMATWCSVSSAATISWLEYPDTGAIPGYRTYGLFVDIQGTWCCAAMYFELTNGSFYQDPAGDVKIYEPYLPALFPTVVYDTYVAEGSYRDVGAIGGAGDVGGPPELIFNETVLNVSWGVLGGQRSSGFFQIAQITLSMDAAGTWRLATIGAATPYTEFSGTVADIVPEPKGYSLLLLLPSLMARVPVRIGAQARGAG